MPPVPPRPRSSWALPLPPGGLAAAAPGSLGDGARQSPPPPPPPDFLAALPDELLTCIVGALPAASDVAALGRTCSRLAAAAAPRLAVLRGEWVAARAAAAASAPVPQPSHPLYPL